MGFSYSKVSTYWGCPRYYKFIYLDKLQPKDDLRPSNPLYLGSALHEGIEKRSVEEAINKYKSYFPEITPAHEFEIKKLTEAVKKANAILPEGEYEYCVRDHDGFIGYIDMLVKIDEGLYDLYDFKFSNNVNKYKSSPQVLIYKYYYERVTGNKIRDMYYVMVPKLMDEYKEDDVKLNEALDNYVNEAQVSLEKVDFDRAQINYFFARKTMMQKDTTFLKRQTRGCSWCNLRKYCETDGEDKSELKEI